MADRPGLPAPVNAVRAVALCAALALCGTAALCGCGLRSGQAIADPVQPGSIGQGKPLRGVTLTVTSKNFSEQIILGEMMGLALKAAGATVIDKTNIQGSIGARQAVLKGTADAMYEYTGTAWITYLGHTRPITDPHAQWQAVRDEDARNGLTWLPPATLDNTYALASNQANQRRYGYSTLSDVAALSRSDPGVVTLCVENEFDVRDDGLPGMEKAYGMRIPVRNIRIMDSGIVYTQVSQGTSCALGEVFTTDGRIAARHLRVLADDRHFFPDYNAAPEINSRSLRSHPAIATVLEPITAKLTTENQQRLNAKVDVEGQDPREVAKDWLVREGFIKSG
ncbi:glycine betaine ABC transporter substrate-binding protein [Streptomyces silvisoli]|uniref:Glycine betaine ABC transporter substrate-binding protein n=1 Tax=Streptomyces silvisoli TaxID=3034235 RepID=A0ABT5ZTG3_9ACTN|nr:glycine betaine ABC transporter substrate-binding protein [Streptomyces silvisoli]MDF3292941.1 glycine betaine ABC transporter substrate-binding protein [Streptomyces silvisoli]